LKELVFLCVVLTLVVAAIYITFALN